MTDAASAAEPLSPPPASFMAAVREALAGSHRDFTQGPVGRALLVLAVPMVLEMVMESVFAVCDVFFVARLGAGAVATVGLTESMLACIYAVAMGLSIGATATVARRIGEKDPDGAGRAAAQSLWLGLAFSVTLGALGLWLAPRLLAVMGADPGVIAGGTTYARVMLGGSGTVIILFLVNAIFRGAGDAAIAMRVLWFANAINIVLGPCLIFGLGPFPRMGVTGAATATTIGRATGAVYAIWRLTRTSSRVSVRRRHLRPDPALAGRLLRLSASGALQAFVGTASWIGLVRIISLYGSPALAGYTIGIRVIIFALLPSWGVSNAAATMVGQALGAGKPERAVQAVRTAGLYNMAFLGAVGVLFVVLAPMLVALFTHDPAVSGYAVSCLRIVAFGFALYGWGMVLTAAFNGAGDTLTPTLINLGVFWLFEIPLAWLLARRIGPSGVFWAITIAFSTLALVSGLLFQQGRWKTRRV
jgi:putative MATE family efflux protein